MYSVPDDAVSWLLSGSEYADYQTYLQQNEQLDSHEQLKHAGARRPWFDNQDIHRNVFLLLTVLPSFNEVAEADLMLRATLRQGENRSAITYRPLMCQLRSLEKLS